MLVTALHLRKFDSLYFFAFVPSPSNWFCLFKAILFVYVVNFVVVIVFATVVVYVDDNVVIVWRDFMSLLTESVTFPPPLSAAADVHQIFLSRLHPRPLNRRILFLNKGIKRKLWRFIFSECLISHQFWTVICIGLLILSIFIVFARNFLEDVDTSYHFY